MARRWGWTFIAVVHFACGCAIGRQQWMISTPPAPGEASLDLITNVRSLDASDRECLRALLRATIFFPYAVGDPPAARQWPDAAREIRCAAAAAEAGGRGRLAAYLSAAARDLEGQDAPALDRVWYRAADSPIVVLVGRPSPLRALHVGLRDDDESAWVNAYLARFAEFERSLPLPAGQVPRTEPYGAPFIIANVAFRAGSALRSTSSSTALPLDPALTPDLGRGWVFWKNVMRDAWFASAIEPAAALVLDRDQMPLATARAHLFFYATRFSTYALGPQCAPSEAGPVPLEAFFGDLHAPLVIAKSDLLGTLAQLWLVDQGVQPREVSREMLAMLVTMSFRAMRDAIAGDAPKPHESASRLILGYACEKGALAFDADSGRWRFDETRLREAIRSLAGEILAIHATGDLARGRSLLDAYARPSPEITSTLDRLAAIPRVSRVPRFIVQGL